jgi:hypothetical protein
MCRKLKIRKLFSIVCAFAAAFGLFFWATFFDYAAAQQENAPSGKILARLDFAPEIHGFGFQNYGNQNRFWQDDITTDDMIRLFGARSVCKAGGTTAQNCILRESAAEWMRTYLEIMDNGHCDGMATVSLRFWEKKEFKRRTKPGTFQKNAETTNALGFAPSVENYIAYYFFTQLTDQIHDIRDANGNKPPTEMVKMLVDAMNTGKEVYTLDFYKPGFKMGHAVTPIAVEDTGSDYQIHVYDNNFPNETRRFNINKSGKQVWRYESSANPKMALNEYTGDMTTKTFRLTPNSAREQPGNRTFKAAFMPNSRFAGAQHANLPRAGNNLPGRPSTVDLSADETEYIEFAYLGPGEVLIVAPDGKRVGFDSQQNRIVNEIAGAKIAPILVEADEDVSPIYRLRHVTGGKPYTIKISGRTLDDEADGDLLVSAPNFAVGFDEILLDEGENLTVTVAPDGEELSFTASADGETPEIFFAFDTDDASYKVEITGARLTAGKTLTARFDPETGKLVWRDNDGDEDRYDIDLRRTNADGSVNNYETDDIETGAPDNYEMDFGKWDGKSAVCVRDDDDGNGFANDECEPQPNEENDRNVQGDADGDGDTDDDGIFDNQDPDDDNDGKPDKIDSDDDNDGIPDNEDEDQADFDADGVSDAEDADDDNDGEPDDEDEDDDNDGIPDDEDADNEDEPSEG